MAAANPATTVDPVEKFKNWVWQLDVCNACRYCEGFCAVFPALERRRDFTMADVDYLANLCFDCRACYYACMFSPPHEFGVNIPQMMSEVRRETYARYALPTLFARLLRSSWFAIGLLAVLSAALFVLIVASTGPLARMFQPQAGKLYGVIPYDGMVTPNLLISLAALALLVVGVARFWRSTRGSLADWLHPGAVLTAAADALGVRYLTGGGAGGCTYPKDKPTFARWLAHNLVFWGFLSAFVATTLAYIYQHFLGWYPPYPYFSAPVIFGTVGGVAMIVGCVALLVLKRESDKAPADRPHLVMDNLFIWTLLAINVTGLALLVLRDTAAMGTLLVIHLGTVLALFLTIPYTKFAHFVYRYAALVQNRLEEREHVGGGGGH